MATQSRKSKWLYCSHHTVNACRCLDSRHKFVKEANPSHEENWKHLKLELRNKEIKSYEKINL